MSPDGLIVALTREVILRRPEVPLRVDSALSLQCRSSRSPRCATLHPYSLRTLQHRRSMLGLGTESLTQSHIAPVCSHWMVGCAHAVLAVGIPDGKIFIVNSNGEVQNGTSSSAYKKSYQMILDLKDVMFPPLKLSLKETGRNSATMKNCCYKP